LRHGAELMTEEAKHLIDFVESKGLLARLQLPNEAQAHPRALSEFGLGELGFFSLIPHKAGEGAPRHSQILYPYGYEFYFFV